MFGNLKTELQLHEIGWYIQPLQSLEIIDSIKKKVCIHAKARAPFSIHNNRVLLITTRTIFRS